ncbi:MAG TPA: protein kinase [Cyanobacteria bacterium UBA11149]|nr:protein kinase [Cyanobacteria bacterium UBA11367]HBE56566.1 protein kinase [Cyanobacteria bacterium UBA11366]HBK63909.1 protein kinase [Cyanobacteria bacterium UBA11166]HBR74510.1 protein kinase [Cyanobacteria bacterium UBA11159]HBS72541.1 protein kinase [Cyanobacteria bacterium UBA11153]HBW87544.1 protein kinase [Cyanobacteria bacterium UBA11149]HCA96618.1 protein kinase [Cyanobacteria bacterium UBA9226]
MTVAIGEIIGGRYQIIRRLGEGGFGTTFVAQDKHLPGDEYCVVKQLKPQANDPATLQIARRLFETEAKILNQLGTHNQIPQLYAYFEEDREFYLVQEFIEGEDLSHEIIPANPLTQLRTISLLREILEILEYVHQHNVIHRDINPHNIIRRKSDEKLVLIDFGAVKQISTQIVQSKQTSFTVAIGTPGYQPGEQANGNPRLSSDIYAVGMVGIAAVTGIPPYKIPHDPDSGEIIWQNRANVTAEFAKVLDKMTRYDFRDRYLSAQAALQAVNDIGKNPTSTVLLPAQPSPAIQSKPSPSPPSPGSKQIWSKVAIGIAAASIIGVSGVAIANWRTSTNAINSYQRGETLFELKRYQDALDAYNRALELKPEYTEALAGQGDALLQLNRSQEAIEAYEKAIQLQPDYATAWKGRGIALDKLQKYEEAINALDEVLKLTPEDWETWTNRGEIQIKLQRFSGAIASFDKVLAIKPDNPSVWYQRGWAYQNLRQYQEAIDSYTKALKYKPDSPQTWYQLGNSQINLQKYLQAAQSYQKATQFQPKFYEAWYSQGNAWRNIGQYEEALAAFDQAVKIKPRTAEAWYNRGGVLHQLQRYEEAVNSYNKAVQYNPNSSQSWYNRGNGLYILKKYQDAIASYKKAVALKPDHYQAWYSLGNAYVNLQQSQNAIALDVKLYEEAIAAYNQALRYKPDYLQAQAAKEQTQRLIDSIPPPPPILPSP